jgi:GTP-binding protein Era
MTSEARFELGPPGTPETRAGYVAVMGLPNAGKSSLLNALIEQKLSIVTPRPQTTREKVVGIATRDGVQMIFVDTPGLLTPASLLHGTMMSSAKQAIADADVAVLVMDGTRPPPADDALLDAPLRQKAAPLIPVINKADIASPVQVEALQAWLAARTAAPPVVASALTGDGVGDLREQIAQHLPCSPFLYPADEVSSQPVRFFVAELIRETVFELFRQEIPHSVAVGIEEFVEDADPIRIRATIYVERASQKGILIGRGGSSMRDLGTQARIKIQDLLDAHVHLDLWVKVLHKWRKNPASLRRLGFRNVDQ